jgi:NAD(P)-dependent dehydrogenase (short-subunit alcohol dehydrogenase family)
MHTNDGMDPAGRAALVSGAGSGIGRAIALSLAEAGARVALVGRDADRLAAVAATIAERDGEAFAVPADLADERQLETAVRMARSALGPIEILVHNAGIAHSGLLTKTSDEDMDRVLAINLHAAFLLAAAVAADMKAAGWGRIIHVGSTASLRGFPYCSLYTASKHALAGLTRSLAAELLPHGITVNLVCPGYVDTALVDRAADSVATKTGRDASDVKAHFARSNPLGRLVTPEEVAEAVLRFCGPGSAAVSAESYVIDGGTQPL